MTGLLILAASSAISPGGGGGGAPPAPPPSLTKPSPIDGTASSMRPNGRLLATYTVSATDPTANYTTIGAAITAAKAAQVAAGKQDAVAWNSTGVDIGPDYRVDIVIGPGTYAEHIGGSAWINLYGCTGNPADVIISDSSASDGTLHAFGATYLEGITLLAATSGPKYPLHLGSDATLSTVNCVLTATSAAGDGAGAAVGMDGGSGSCSTFYRSTLTAAPGASWVANMHSAVGNAAALTLTFASCTLNNVVTYSDLGTGLADQLYFIGNTGGSVSVTSGAAVVTHTTGSWPIPAPYSARDTAFFYPSQIGTAHTQLEPTVTDAAAMTPVANRIYMTRIPISTAIHATHYGITAAAAGGTWAGWMGRIQGTPTATPGITPSVSIAAAGLREAKHFYYYSLYPGETDVWVAATFSTGASVMGSGQLPGLADCYYSDDGGVTVTHVSAGTAFPLAQIRSAT